MAFLRENYIIAKITFIYKKSYTHIIININSLANASEVSVWNIRNSSLQVIYTNNNN